MKKTLTISALLSICISSFAKCDMEVKTKRLIDNIDKFNVQIKQGFVKKDIEETKQLIQEGTYCSDNFAPLSLCTSITTEHAYFGGLQTEDESDQYELEKSLYEFALKFPVPTSTSFGCNLKELEFPTLD